MKNLRLMPVIILVLGACSKNQPTSQNQLPSTSVNYEILDTMRLQPSVQFSNPDVYNSLNNKVYSLKSNKGDVTFSKQGTDIVLMFNETTISNFGSSLDITFKNKNLGNLSGIYQLNSNSICLEMGQNLLAGGNNAWVGSSGCESTLTGTIELSYDTSTNRLSGKITGLSFPFGYYIPTYLQGQSATQSTHLLLEAGGSDRTVNVTFSNAKEKL